MNKHLLKIINEYIDYKLKYVDELKNNTIGIYSDVDVWRYNINYCIVYDHGGTRPIGYTDEWQYRTRRYNNYWNIYPIFDLN
jgi:hypothetical protein